MDQSNRVVVAVLTGESCVIVNGAGHGPSDHRGEESIMNSTIRQLIVRLNASYIGFFAFFGLIFDIRGVLYGTGPQGQVLANAPLAGIGFVEAHGLALILSVVLWRAAGVRASHLTAMAMDLLLGVSNLAFWQLFVVTDALTVGYVSTSLHLSFALLQAWCWTSGSEYTLPIPDA
jgi:hypothetical protein